MECKRLQVNLYNSNRVLNEKGMRIYKKVNGVITEAGISNEDLPIVLLEWNDNDYILYLIFNKWSRKTRNRYSIENRQNRA